MKKNVQRLMLVIAVAFITFFVACSDEDNGQNEECQGFCIEEFRETFQSQKSAWENLGIDHYEYTVRHPAIPPTWSPPLTIVVSPDREPEIIKIDGLDVSVEWHEEQDHKRQELIRQIYEELIPELDIVFGRVPLTITQLYLSLERQVQSNTHEAPFFDSYEGVYNENYHFPEIFFMRPQEGWTGPGSGVTITYFEDLRDR